MAGLKRMAARWASEQKVQPTQSHRLQLARLHHARQRRTVESCASLCRHGGAAPPSLACTQKLHALHAPSRQWSLTACALHQLAHSVRGALEGGGGATTPRVVAVASTSGPGTLSSASKSAGGQRMSE